MKLQNILKPFSKETECVERVEGVTQNICRLEEIDFKTNLCINDIIEIAEKYIEQEEELYEIDRINILYDANSYVTHEPVWYVSIINFKTKQRWPDAYESECLAISDKEKRVVYVSNDHGVVVKKF